MQLTQITKLIKQGIEVRYWVNGQQLLFTPLDRSKIRCMDGFLIPDCPLGVDDQVLVYLRGEPELDKIVKFQQLNYLPRFKMSCGKWLGKTKLIAKVTQLS